MGRYTQTDPVGLAVDGNTYRYGYNNPALVADPHGDIGFIGAGIGAVIGGVSGYMYTGTWQGALGGAVIGGAAGFIGQFGTSLGAGMLFGTLTGGGEDLAFQMIVQGKSLKCVDWGQTGYSTLLGGATGGLGHWAGKWAAARKAVKAAERELITVRTYTGTIGREGITSSGALNANTWVTLPGEIPPRAGHLQIEKLLEIKPGRGSNFLEFGVPTSNLRVPANGPRTSGGALQFQLNEPVPIDPSTFWRPPGRPGG
jgi:hypothetical protein